MFFIRVFILYDHKCMFISFGSNFLPICMCQPKNNAFVYVLIYFILYNPKSVVFTPKFGFLGCLPFFLRFYNLKLTKIVLNL
jgi:hypothetical protein